MKGLTLIITAYLCVAVEQVIALNNLTGRVAVVTGASSGIGKAIATRLVKNGMNVVGLARRQQLMQDLSDSLEDESGKLYAVKCDVTIEENVVSAFEWIKDNLGAVDVLVNCAGVAYNGNLTDGSVSNWQALLNTNVLGLSICTREAVQSMTENQIEDAQIINFNSVVGHFPSPRPETGMYTATKHAVTSLTDSLRRELISQNSTIRVTSVSPGATNTPLLEELLSYMSPEQLQLVAANTLEPDDIADTVFYLLGTPSNVQIFETTVIPRGSTF